jgi:hypothetical protein
LELVDFVSAAVVVVQCDVGCTPQLISSVNLLIIVDFVVIVGQFLDFAVTLELVEAEELIVIVFLLVVFCCVTDH